MPPRQAIDLLNDFGVIRLRQFVQERLQKDDKWSRDPVNGCFLATGANSEGYVALKKYTNQHIVDRANGIERGYTSIALHRVAYVAFHGQNPPPGTEVSHLCDRRHCFWARHHLVAESGSVNRDRRFCRGVLRCPRHDRVIADGCSHIPKCIKPGWSSSEFDCCCGHDAPCLASESSQAEVLRASQQDVDELLAEDFSQSLSAEYLEDPPEDAVEEGVDEAPAVDSSHHSITTVARQLGPYEVYSPHGHPQLSMRVRSSQATVRSTRPADFTPEGQPLATRRRSDSTPSSSHTGSTPSTMRRLEHQDGQQWLPGARTGRSASVGAAAGHETQEGFGVGAQPFGESTFLAIPPAPVIILSSDSDQPSLEP
jgi:hypothetical protein